jgi:hypothetical protein
MRTEFEGISNMSDLQATNATFYNDMRIQTPDTFILENDLVKVTLNPSDGGIASFIDKKTGVELATGQAGMGIYRLANECVNKGITYWKNGMSAWFIGRYNEIQNIDKRIEIVPYNQGPL